MCVRTEVYAYGVYRNRMMLLDYCVSCFRSYTKQNRYGTRFGIAMLYSTILFQHSHTYVRTYVYVRMYLNVMTSDTRDSWLN